MSLSAVFDTAEPGLVTVLTQGAQEHRVTVLGVRGPGAPGGALLTANRLSEFAADPAAQGAAQQNLGLGSVDPLAYYILAKA